MEELDDLGVPIKKKSESEVDDLGVPLKKNRAPEPVTSTSPTGTASAEIISEPSVKDIPQFQKPETLYPESAPVAKAFNPNQKYRDTLLDTTLSTFQGNPMFQEPKYRQIYYKRLAEKGISPSILDQVIHEGENAYLSPAQKLGKSVATIGANTIEAPGNMGAAGLETLKGVPEAFDEYAKDGSATGLYKGVGNATLQTVKGVGEILMGGLSITPPGMAFNAVAGTASEIAPEVTHAIMAPVTTFVLNNLYKDEPAPRWAQNSAAILDFLAFAKGAHLASKGIGEATKANDIKKILNEVDPAELKAYSDKMEQQYGEKKNVFEIPEKESIDLENNIEAVKSDIAKSPELEQILAPKLEQLTKDNDALQESIAATAVQDAHVEAMKDAVSEGIAELEAKKDGMSPASVEAIDQTINQLKESVEEKPLNTKQNVQESAQNSTGDAPGVVKEEKIIEPKPKEIADEPVIESVSREAKAEKGKPKEEPVLDTPVLKENKSFDETHGIKHDDVTKKVDEINQISPYKALDKAFEELGIKEDDIPKAKADYLKEFVSKDLPSKLPNKKHLFNAEDLPAENLNIKPIESSVKPLKDKSTDSKRASLKDIVNDDSLRPIMSGVYMDAENGVMVATDAHKLMAITDKTIKKSQPVNVKTGEPLTPEFLKDNTKFPNYKAVIPENNPIKIKINIPEMLSKTEGIARANKFFDGPKDLTISGKITVGENDYFFNPKLLSDVLKVFAQHGSKDVTMELSTPNRAMLIKDGDVLGLLMPIYGEVGTSRFSELYNKALTAKEKTDLVQADLDILNKRLDERKKELADARKEVRDAKSSQDLNSANFEVKYTEGKIREIEKEIADKKSEFPDNPLQEAQDINVVKKSIKDGEISGDAATEFIQKPKRSRKSKSVIEDIERKAESDNEVELNEAVKQADELLNEKEETTPAVKETTVKKGENEIGDTAEIIFAGTRKKGEITEINNGVISIKGSDGATYTVKPHEIIKEGETFDDAINRINKKRKKEAEPEPYQKKISEIKGSRKALLDQLKQDTKGQLNAGIDPSHIPTLIKIGKTYLEEGVVHFEHFARKLYEDLKGLGIRFNRNDPEFQKDVAHIYNESKKQRFENISPDVALSVQRKAADLSEAKIKQAKRKTWDKFYKGFVRHIEDIAGNVKEALRNAGGEDAVMMKDIANKSNGKASLKIEELNKKIFHGLKEPELKDLGNIIQAKRTIQLDEMYDARKQPRLNHELGHTKEFYEAVLDGMEKENPEQFKKLSDKADDYFKAMQDLLKEKKENGLIDKAAYEVLKEQSMYSPRAFIQHMDQIENGFNNKNAVSNNGIKKLDEGSEGLLDKDPQFLLANTVSRAYSLMAKNDAAKTLLDFAENNTDNGVVEPRKISGNTLNDKVAKEVNKFEEQKGVTLTPAQIDAIRQKIIDADYDNKVEEFADKYNKQPTQLQKDILKERAEKGENTYAPVPSGKEVISAFVDGHKRDMLMDKEQAAEWMGTDPAISAALGEATQWLTGANLLRYTATGINPAFALANAPRDMAYIYLTTHGTYSKHLPAFVKQIHQDMATVASDAIKRTGRYKEFINEGGSIELLTHQGRFNLTKGINEGVNKISHALGYIGETSELMTRLAMRERGIKNGTKEFEKQNGRPPTPDELNKIKVKATYDAVNQLDFSQGGDWSKALNKFVPYLNAAMQANRGLFREMKTNPKAFAYKAAQLATVAGGLAAYNLSQPGYDQISDDEKARYYIMMLGGLYSTDANGNKNYRYLKLAKSQETQFITAVAENAVEFATTGKARPKEMMHGLKNQMPPIPFLTQDVPMAEMLRTYESNYDRFYDRKLWHGQEGLSPELEFNPAGKYKTPEIYRKLGETTGLSPERVRGSLPKLLVGTERNPFMTIPGKAFQVAAEGMGITERDALNKTLTQNLDDMFKGTYSKFYGETNPMRKTGYDEEVLTAETDAKKKMNDDVKSYIDKNLGKDVDKEKAIADFRAFVDKKYKDAEPKERARMVNSFRTGLQDSKLDYWYVKLSNYSTDSRAKIFKNRYDSTSEGEREDMRKIMKENIDINTPAFRNKLKTMGFKDDLEPEPK